MSTFKVLSVIFFLCFVISSFAQKGKQNYVLAFSDSSSGEELWGFKNKNGEVVIKPRYEAISTDTLVNFAFVTLHYEWIAINSKDIILLRPYIFDNGPDYFQEGLFRYVENGKIGFANTSCVKIIPAQFDFATPFSNGLASFNIGGKMEKWDAEHSVWKGGVWGFINKKGKVVIEPTFSKAYDFRKGNCEVWTKENEHILIDKKGRKIRSIAD